MANVANLLPPVLFMTVASLVYLRYGGVPAVRGALGMVRYAVFAMMIAIAVKLVDTSRLADLKVLPVVLVAFLLLRLTSVHPATRHPRGRPVRRAGPLSKLARFVVVNHRPRYYDI